MMKSLFLSILLAIFFSNSSAIEKNYSVANIPVKLMAGANAVKRSEIKEFRINNTRSAMLRHHYVITILNENGDTHAGLEVYYDKLKRVSSISGTLYNAAGGVLKKLKDKDIKDLSATDNNNLAEDSRVKTHNFNHMIYPYTIEYEIVEEINNTFMFPSWIPQQGILFSVEESVYHVIYPEKYQVRYKTFNYTGEPEKTTSKGNTIMSWKTKDMPAIKVPFATSSWTDLTTVVYIAPSDFEISGYKGNMNTWEGFGKFQNSLNAGKDVLPAHIIQQVKALTSGITDVKEKINILYNYLQKNTRYISIQLGIGGWQPFDASYVAKNGYGDCKALTNYMQSLLTSANIPSFYTLVYAGASGTAKNRFVPDLSSQQFNHVVICVPTGKDSVWLECTDQQSPAGYMGDFTGNRKALMITDKGGVIVSTPRYGIDENLQMRTITATLEKGGTLNMKVNTSYACIQQDRISSRINALSDQKIKEFLEESMPLSSYHINDFKYRQNRSEFPSVEEDLDITINNFATISGKRIFLLPNLLNRSGILLTPDSSRRSDFVFDYAYRDKDEVEIEIPEGYEIESDLKDISLKTPIGNYTVTSKLEGNKIIYTRLREQFSGRFPENMQNDIIQFYKDIHKSDRARIVLVKKGE